MRNGTGGKKKRKKKASSQPVTERNHPRDSFKILYRKESGYIISLGAIPTLWPLRWQFTSFLPGEKNSTFPRRPVIILLCFRRPSFTTNGKFLSLCASTRDENKRRRKTRQPNTLRVSHLLFTTATILYINIVKRKKRKKLFEWRIWKFDLPPPQWEKSQSRITACASITHPQKERKKNLNR